MEDFARPDGAATPETVVVLDFGSQYSQIIARRIRECQVYCELLPFDSPPERVMALSPRAFVLSGGPASVYEPGAPQAPDYVFQSGVPVLGICYGMQLMAHQLGGSVAPGGRREYGHATLQVVEGADGIFDGLPVQMPVWMSHGDEVARMPTGFALLARTANTAVAAMGNGQGIFGVQFHPEVVHTPFGKEILRNFLFKVCGLHGTWTAANFIAQSIQQIRERVGGGQVICALSGGVDSAVAATLTARAIGDQLTCIFVNNGLLREGEADQVQQTFREHQGMKLIYVDASERFLRRLAGVEDPEQKRRIVGEEFIRVFEDEADRLGRVDFLVQGTLYPDVIESTAPETRVAARIKTHHNVGGLPEQFDFRLIEPLRYLFKDEVRSVGLELGMPESLIWRHPFPGPGLSVRVIGEVTEERLAVLRRADAIFIEELRAANHYRQVAQALAVLTPLRSVGVMGDGRTYANVVALRAVTTEDFMTADWAHLPYDLLARVSSRIVNEVPGVNRVVYDISSKPPSTIEWE